MRARNGCTRGSGSGRSGHASPTSCLPDSMRVIWESPDPRAAAARLRNVLGADVIATQMHPDPRARDDRIRVIDDPTDDVALVVAFATVDAERAASERGWVLQPLPPDLVL